MSETEQVRAVSAAYLEAVQAGDADRAAKLFTEDAVMLPPNAMRSSKLTWAIVIRYMAPVRRARAAPSAWPSFRLSA